MSELDFNNGWLFWKEGDTQKTQVSLPHDAMIHEVRDPENDNSHNSGFFPGGKYFYQKYWVTPSEYRGKRIWIVFDGVYRRARVSVNGKEIGARPNGFIPFMVDCSDQLRFGEENEICVTADNSSTPNARWYTGSGIYRPVKLLLKNDSHIVPQGIKVVTKSINPPRILVTVAHTGGEVDIEIKHKGKIIACTRGDKTEIELPGAELWSAEHPVLYQCCARLKDEEGNIQDEETISFGIRSLSWSPDGFFVNDQEVKLRGACIHSDNGALGARAFTEAEERRIRVLKEAGFNAIRSSHNPCAETTLEAADRLGMYVMDEFSDVWYKHKQAADYASDFEDWHLLDICSLVERDLNHPSVIMYSLGNEIGEVWEEKGIEVTREMAETCRKIDPTRPVTCGTNLMVCSMDKRGIGTFSATDTKEKKPKKHKKVKKKKGKMVGSELYNLIINIMGSRMDKESLKPACDKATYQHFSHLDICGYNYGSIRYEGEKDLYPERIIVGSESRPPNIVENWRLIQKLSYVIGDFMWTGWDYLGEAGIGVIAYSSRREGGLLLKKYPYLLAGCGVIDICGDMRPEVWLNRAAWGMLDGKPYIGVEPLTFAKEKRVRTMWRRSNAVHSWSWAGCEGRRAEIVVYSDGAEVELFLNGISLGKQKVRDCEAYFKTAFQPGRLEAVSYDRAGNETGRDILKSAEKTKLVLKPEKNNLQAGGQDLVYLNVLLMDENGVVECAADTQVHLTVQGPGSLQAFGSANPYTEEGFVANEHATFYGRAQAVIRSGDSVGEINVTATAEGFLPAEIVLTVER